MSETTKNLIKVIFNIFDQFELYISLIGQEEAINLLISDLVKFDDLFGDFDMVKMVFESTKKNFSNSELIEEVLEAEAIFNKLFKD